jgi:hypothetical protein
MTRIQSISCLFAMAIGSAAPAQDSHALMLREGASITLRLTKPLSSKTARPGDVVDLELAKDIRIDDALIVREGTKAVGEVTLAKKAGHMGEGGDLAIRVTEVRSGDSRIKLRGTQGKAGDSKFAYALAFGVFGMLKHGKNAELPAGATITAYVAEDVAVSMLSVPRSDIVARPTPQGSLSFEPIPAPPSPDQLPLGTAAILQMKAAGLSDELIVTMAAKVGLEGIDPSDLIKMKAANISDKALSQLVTISVKP